MSHDSIINKILETNLYSFDQYNFYIFVICIDIDDQTTCVLQRIIIQVDNCYNTFSN